MKERIFQTLSDLRAYARQKGYEATFFCMKKTAT